MGANMNRLERLATALLVTALACTQILSGQFVPDTVPIVEPHLYVNAATRLMAMLGKVADTATVEHFACLVGDVLVSRDGADTLLAVKSAWLPKTRSSAHSAVTGVACPAGTVLGWHNHIYSNVKAYFEGEGWPVTGETAQACYLSPVDLRNGLWTVQKVYGEVVQVDSKTFCWWFTSQLAAI